MLGLMVSAFFALFDTELPSFPHEKKDTKHPLNAWICTPKEPKLIALLSHLCI